MNIDPKLIRFDNLNEFPVPPMLVKGLIGANSMFAIYGEPKSFKSFVALDLALHMAAGEDWFTAKISRQCRVLYVSLEGKFGFIQRMKALNLAKPELTEFAKSHFACATHLSVSAFEPESIQNLIKTAGDFDAEVVIIDTMARMTPGGNENSSDDMGIAIMAMEKIQHELNASVGFVHHTPKKGKTLRGHNSLTGAIDTGILIEKSGNASGKISTPIQKDTEAYEPFCDFHLQTIPLEVDDEGDPISSCIIDLKPPSRASKKPQENSLTLHDHALEFVTNYCLDNLVEVGETMLKKEINKKLRESHPLLKKKALEEMRHYSGPAFKELEDLGFAIKHRKIERVIVSSDQQ